ncbi:MAG: hypothetical protein GKS05_05180 [Nitrospirales bacterium]|nr:hypothetical protein [Nitrospirales bacterium]
MATSTLYSMPSVLYVMMNPNPDWKHLAGWWIALSHRLGVGEKGQSFFANVAHADNVLIRIHNAGGDVHYLLFVLLRHWIPVVLPPPGRERLSKSDPDYWLESAQILEAAVSRLRELRPLIDLLTSPTPFKEDPRPTPAVVEVELASMLEDLANVAKRYGGPDYTSTVKNFDPVPLRQIQPFKHNKKHSAELWVVFLLREHFRFLGMGKDRYWPLIAELVSAAGIRQPNDLPYPPGELKSWWMKNWPRTYTLLTEKDESGHATHMAFQSDYEWFQAWFAWQLSQQSSQNL